MQKHFLLISFLPALVYWYLEENYPLHIALIGGIGLAVIEICFEKIYTKKVHKISLFNFLLILSLGGLSLLGDQGIWFKLQPFFTGVILGGLILILRRRGHSLWGELVDDLSMKRRPPKELLLRLEVHLAYFLITTNPNLRDEFLIKF